MPLSITWNDIGLRLALTVAAGLALGFNRSEHGKAAGMRTTLLVCIAASVAMIQVNLLLPTAGPPAGSFVMNDLMRLPLGILTGMGFIGGGAQTKANNGCKPQRRRRCDSSHDISASEDRSMRSSASIVRSFRSNSTKMRRATATSASRLQRPAFRSMSNQISLSDGHGRKLSFKLRYVPPQSAPLPPSLLEVLATQPGVKRVDWRDSA